MPSPYQAGIAMRDWVQAKTHGIARRSSSRRLAGWSMPGEARRLAGREAMLSSPIHVRGVASATNRAVAGSSWAKAR